MSVENRTGKPPARMAPGLGDGAHRGGADRGRTDGERGDLRPVDDPAGDRVSGGRMGGEHADARGRPAPVLRLERVSLGYSKTLVLRDATLSVRPGEVVGVLGPNGSGKSTLFKAICGRLRPRDGRLRAPDRARIGVAPQNLALYPFLTVQENLQVFARFARLRGRSARLAVAAAMRRTGLADHAHHRVAALSGGYARRVNIAAALLKGPALLILDEPTVGIDIDARRSIHEVISHVAESGVAVLIATHDLEQAELLCHKIAFLRQGALGPVGAPQDLIDWAFGGGVAMTVTLRARPTAQDRRRLSGLGLREQKTEILWGMLVDPADASIDALARRLTAVGIDAKEVGRRAPDLDYLFLRLYEKEGRA